MTLTMVHTNWASVTDGRLIVDRKFHTGMQNYARTIEAPITAINPEPPPGAEVMDAISVPLDELGYSVVTVPVDSRRRPSPEGVVRLKQHIGQSRITYGNGMSMAAISRMLGTPYILFLEQDLKTQIVEAMFSTNNFARRGSKAIRRCLNYGLVQIQDMKKAHSLHCNGYPAFDESRIFNKDILLYLDSRLSKELLISSEQRRDRLAKRTSRPLRLLYSGRYEKMKGAADAVRVAIECLNNGLDVEMHCYGQGEQKHEMDQLAITHPTKIFIHDVIPYPDLVEISRTFDLFVCCHIQNDPSCTYLEALGSGLPIVGYGNGMWRRLQGESQAGKFTSSFTPKAVAEEVRSFANDVALLDTSSERALKFATAHTFESEFLRRTTALNQALAGRPSSQAA